MEETLGAIERAHRIEVSFPGADIPRTALAGTDQGLAELQVGRYKTTKTRLSSAAPALAETRWRENRHQKALASIDEALGHLGD